MIAVCLVSGLQGQAEKKSDSARRERAERIRSNNRYYTGVGYGDTYEEADSKAITALCKSISLVYSNSTSATDTNEEELFKSQTAISTYVTLNNSESYEVSTEPGKWEIIRYIEKQQVENDIALRAEKIKLWVMRGRELEKRLEIASALKFFNWAYTLANATSKSVKIDVDGQAYDAKSWLHSHITTVLTSITPTLEGVETHPGELDEYSVNLRVTYLDEPVSDLDFSYVNNGTRIRGQHVKNGFASLAYEKLPANQIELDVEYKYLDEIEGFDPELKAASAIKTPSFSKSTISLPCKGVTPEKFKVGEAKLSKEEKKEIAAAAALAPANTSVKRERIDTQAPGTMTGDAVITAMRTLRTVIDNRDYTGAKPLFTENGYALFMKMVQSGKVQTVGKKAGEDYKAEVAGDYILGKSIPITIKYNGGHKVTENLVCRFNSENKIESIAYSLSKIAEDDIFRQNSWSLPARYAILQFMEDYQTAYALKNIEYIEKIYSDDAVIISGKRNPNLKKPQEGNYFYTDNYTYTRETKEEFIKRLRRDFPMKKYIKLTFEDNEIQEQSGIFSNIFWIEIKQIYRSSNYEDEGYLTLMIDMREADPVIKVRTWAPGKIPLNELMRRFTME